MAPSFCERVKVADGEARSVGVIVLSEDDFHCAFLDAFNHVLLLDGYA